MTPSLTFFLNRSLIAHKQWASVLLACFCLTACGTSERLSPLDSNSTVLAFGDSLTYGTGAGADQSYPAVLDEMIGAKVIRSGVPGEISANGLKRLKVELNRHSPDLVLICHGGNDILRRLPGQATEQNLRAMIELIRQSGAEAVLLAVPNIGLFPSAASYYADLEAELGIPVEYDILSQLQRDNAKKSDAVHFNASGYREMAEAVFELLESEGAL